MYHRSLVLTYLLLLAVISSFAQKPKLLAGPAIGEVTHHNAKIWLAYQGIGEHKIFLKDTAQHLLLEPDSITFLAINGKVAATAHFSDLQPETNYQIIIHINGWGYNTNHHITTLHNTGELRDFDMVMGSCGLIMNWPLKAVLPGFKIRILRNVKNENADFMLWLGDNTYYLGKDYASQENMFHRQLMYRQKHRKLDNLLGGQPNYSIWDDHDFGPNDSNSNFELREESFEVYKNFWPHPYYGLDTLPGVFYTFVREDAQFFMMDNRYFQTDIDIENPEMLGKQQMTWLKNELLNSKATFKFIANGSQVLNTINNHESYLNFPEERQELLDFIGNNNISGVIFLSGDRHIGDVHFMARSGKYTLYDFTCSPLLSPGARLVGYWERNNPTRIDGALIKKRNYTRMYISGEKGNRVLHVDYHNVNGKKIRSYTLTEKELR
jgi:alkaline phosphatase D